MPLPWAAAVLMALAGTAPAAERFVGHARAPGSDTLLYDETHWRYVEAGQPRHLVLYTCADGRAFARKSLDPSPGPTRPDFSFVDGRDGYREGVVSRGDAREVYAGGRDGIKRSAGRDRFRYAVIDAGFDAFVKRHWATLTSGGTVHAPFLVPSHQRTIELRLEPATAPARAEVAVRRFRLVADAWYAFALPSATLDYAEASRQLLRFEGLGSIRDHRGKPLRVQITFPPSERVMDGDFASTIDDVRARPLAKRCDGSW